jgi:hypothetical protein
MLSKSSPTSVKENTLDDPSHSSSSAPKILTPDEKAERLRIRKAKHAEATKRKDKENKKKQRIMDHAK